MNELDLHDALTEIDESFIKEADQVLTSVPDDVPKTGDSFSMLLIVGIAGICLVGIGTCLWLRKKL